MRNPLEWARKLLGWIPGAKHPDTPRVIYYNVWGQDRVRKVLKGRCRKCGFVIPSDEKAVRELVFVCDDQTCDCHRMYGPIHHHVCEVCYDMWHSLYGNDKMKNRNYFRQLDEADKKDRDDWKRRDRMGL